MHRRRGGGRREPEHQHSSFLYRNDDDDEGVIANTQQQQNNIMNGTITTETAEDPLKDPFKDPFPRFAFSELKIGRCIGKGGFSFVSIVDNIHLDEVYDTSESESNLRKDFCQRHSDGNNDLVIKLLRTDLGEEEHVKGVMDLAIEAEFLQTLNHPNIITMQAYANSDPHEARFFILLDRLVMTLERKLPFWRKAVSENAGFWLGPCMGHCCGRSHVLNRLWVERLMVSRDIARAVKYLHSKDIVYRDLKPDNVGFDGKGDLKIFDFGLAKRMEPEYRVDRDLYNLTGNTGSLRYMAPEVAMCEPYDQRVDSYSFGILFWQICNLTTPFQGFSTKMHSEKVVHGRTRPQPSKQWPLAWVQLQQECWSHDTFQRPDFEHIYNVLEEEVNDWSDYGGIPSRATEARAKKHTLREATDALRVMDTDVQFGNEEGEPTVLKHDTNIV